LPHPSAFAKPTARQAVPRARARAAVVDGEVFGVNRPRKSRNRLRGKHLSHIRSVAQNKAEAVERVDPGFGGVPGLASRIHPISAPVSIAKQQSSARNRVLCHDVSRLTTASQARQRSTASPYVDPHARPQIAWKANNGPGGRPYFRLTRR
jgi:hypothetical protein